MGCLTGFWICLKFIFLILFVSCLLITLSIYSFTFFINLCLCLKSVYTGRLSLLFACASMPFHLIYIYIYIYNIYIYIYIIYMYIYIYVCVYIFTYIYIYVCVFMYYIYYVLCTYLIIIMIIIIIISSNIFLLSFYVCHFYHLYINKMLGYCQKHICCFSVIPKQ